MSALGIKAKSLFSGFSPLKRLQRKARPLFSGNAHQKGGQAQIKPIKLTINLMPHVRFKTSYRPALGEHCRKKY